MLQEMTLAREGIYIFDRPSGLSFLAGKPLSAREREIWLLMAGGCSDAEIAERLALNCLTVRFHLSNVLDKLGAASRQEAAALAVRSHLVPDSSRLRR